jgi:hypothetical protein
LNSYFVTDSTTAIHHEYAHCTDHRDRSNNLVPEKTGCLHQVVLVVRVIHFFFASVLGVCFPSHIFTSPKERRIQKFKRCSCFNLRTMQRTTQRPSANASSALLPKSSVIKNSSGSAASVEVPNLKGKIASKSRTIIRKRQTHVKDGCVLTIDPHVILRTLILLLATLCCFIARRSLSGDATDFVAKYSKYTRLSSSDDKENGKGRILQLLKEAGIIDLDNETISRLPTWEEVMYVHIFLYSLYMLVAILSYNKYEIIVPQ